MYFPLVISIGETVAESIGMKTTVMKILPLSHDITTSADGAWSVYAVDVDGDGDMDVLSASLREDTIAWYENDGNENFTPHMTSQQVRMAPGQSMRLM